MTTIAYVEFAFIRPGYANAGPPYPLVIDAMIGSRTKKTVTAVVDTDADDILVPTPTIPPGADAALNNYVAIITAVGGNIIVDWGPAPDSSQAGGKLVLAGTDLTVHVNPGEHVDISVLS